MKPYATIIVKNMEEKMLIERALINQVKSLHSLHTNFPHMKYPSKDLIHAKNLMIREFAWTEDQIQRLILK